MFLLGWSHARLTLPESLRSGELGVNEPGALKRRIAESLGPPMLKRWQDQGEVSADTLLSALPRGEPVDVVGRFVRPWALELARLVTQADAGEPALLVALCEQVSAAAASPEESRTVQRAQEAGTQLDALLVACGFPMAGPTFVALSQTCRASWRKRGLRCSVTPRESRL